MGARYTFLRSHLIGALLACPFAGLAQSDCDSIVVQTLGYAPFNDTALVAVAYNTGDMIVAPVFALAEPGGDIIAQGVMEFFGMWSTPQLNPLPMVEGVPLPTSPFTGSLELDFQTMASPVHCSFPLDQHDLCPPSPCVPLQIHLYQFGADMDSVTTSFTWSVTDHLGATVDSGVLSLDEQELQQVFAGLCLAPGQYDLHVSQDDLAGSQFAFGLSQGEGMFSTVGPTAVLEPGTSATLHFPYYPLCFAGTQGIEEAPGDAPMLIVDGRSLQLIMRTAEAMGPVALSDASGRSVHQASITGSNATLDLSGLASGAYVLRSLKMEAPWPAQRFVLP